MKTLLKIFLILVCLAPELAEGQVNTSTRQIRFYPVRAASDTAATVGNSGRMWYDFISNKFRGNVGGTNFTFGSGGGGNFWSLTGNSQLIDNTVEIRRNTGNPFLFINSTITGLLSPNGLSTLNVSDSDFTIGGTYSGSGASITGNSTSITFSKGLTNWFIIGNTGIQFNLASSATGDIWYRNSSALVTRLAKGAEGTLLRAGASVPAYSTFTIPNTIAALSIFAANSANVLTAITPAAGQSIRVNAGGTAWEAYTPGTGGGFTNGAANNELIKSDGTNGVSSGIFAVGNADLNFGSVSTGSEFRDLTAVGSEANITFRYNPKGVGGHVFTGGNFFVNTSQAAFTSTHQIGVEPSNKRITFTRLTDTPSTWTMRGSSGTAGNNNGDDFTISGGHALLSGTGNGGNLILEGGSENSGSGSPGNVYTRYEGELINLALFEPVQETGTSFTFDYSHLGKSVVTTNGSAVTATLNALQVGYITKVIQFGSGNITLSAGANVVLQGKTSTTGPGDDIVIHAYILDSGDTYYLCE